MSYEILRLHHAGVTVRNLASSVDWYTTHLGFRHQYDFAFPGATASMLVRADARLELFEVEGSSPMDTAREDGRSNLKFGGIHHLALAVDDLDQAVAALEAKGVAIVMPPADVPNGSGDRFAFIHDNERMLIELLEPARPD